jgi:hypothetical protein
LVPPHASQSVYRVIFDANKEWPCGLVTYTVRRDTSSRSTRPVGSVSES